MSNKIKNDDVSLGRFISLVLRHQPQTIGLTLDEHGWADTKALIKGVCATGRKLDIETLERIVRENNKQRYSFNADKSKIRANQGHSIAVDVEMNIAEPPSVLYHGTAADCLDSIREKGILKMSRNYVHLSKDVDTAVKVGSRHGKPVILVIDTAKMSADGFVFRISENGVWQSEDIPWKYVTEIKYP
ncbi:RNA 2'-phosphotransferase [Ruminococcus albus]|uniref:Probable RNA 2'-phosphotransferase n=1 Tax=Ruminococcus albus 8 TaxID=246199 RepID=E9S7C6_RUMAL|nr:RNA 2'-phosphotransferase [Ruminococcus albus]EGC04772.1 RNA 2'-phosphotransferase-like protein [Ruminococcus albus 8]MCC3349404.1 RNA 2'-phosphotransferase [Ruminococcus albus 8]